jgi:hypothetical protein
LLGQTIVVENRPGGSGSIAANAVVQAEPDGHTLLFGIFSHAVAPALARLSYDTLKDFTAVSQVASVPLLMFASQKSPYRSVADVVSAAKAAPDTVTYASGGVGSSAHLAAELLSRRAGIKLVHVPPAHTDSDSVVYFTDANVIHFGDTFFSGRFPNIDLGGGSVLLRVPKDSGGASVTSEAACPVASLPSPLPP